MARNVVIFEFCDPCDADGREEPAVYATTVAVGELRRHLAFCDRHRREYLDQLVAALTDWGEPIEQEPTRTEPAYDHNGHPRELAKFDPPIPCPICTRPQANRSAMVTHVRRVHDTSIEEIEAEEQMPWYQCRACDAAFDQSQKLGAHVWNQHQRTDRKRTTTRRARTGDVSTGKT